MLHRLTLLPPPSTLFPYTTLFRSIIGTFEALYRKEINALYVRDLNLRGPRMVGGSVYRDPNGRVRSEEHTSELQSQSNLVCRLLLEKKKQMESFSRRHVTEIARHP